MKILFPKHNIEVEEIEKVKMKARYGDNLLEYPGIWTTLMALEQYFKKNPNGLVDLNIEVRDKTIVIEDIKKDYTVIITF